MDASVSMSRASLREVAHATFGAWAAGLRNVLNSGDIPAVWDDGQEDMVGSAFRVENGSRSGKGWKADLWAAHPSLKEGHATWQRTARELGDCLTGSVRATGPWWE